MSEIENITAVDPMVTKSILIQVELSYLLKVMIVISCQGFPQATILEDPVTGSARALTPYWSEKLGK